jgi:hypothetical protein
VFRFGAFCFLLLVGFAWCVVFRVARSGCGVVLTGAGVSDGSYFGALGRGPTACAAARRGASVTMDIFSVPDNWTPEEHEAFLLGLEEYGLGSSHLDVWQNIADGVGTKTADEVKTYAHNYFIKLQAESYVSSGVRESHQGPLLAYGRAGGARAVMQRLFPTPPSPRVASRATLCPIDFVQVAPSNAAAAMGGSARWSLEEEFVFEAALANALQDGDSEDGVIDFAQIAQLLPGKGPADVEAR